MRDLYSTDLAGAAHYAQDGFPADRPSPSEYMDEQPPCPECGEREWDGRDCPSCGFEFDPEYHR